MADEKPARSAYWPFKAPPGAEATPTPTPTAEPAPPVKPRASKQPRATFDPAPGVEWLELSGFGRLGRSRNPAFGDGSGWEAKASTFAWTAYRVGGAAFQASTPAEALAAAGWVARG